jgi:O-antigen/teichoic acid export membrane protein
MTEPPPRPSLARNILVNAGSRAALGLLTLVTTPVLLHRLGSQQYGIYVLAVSSASILAIFDLGLGTAVITYVSSSYRAGDRRQLQSVISTALSAYLVLGLAFGLIFAAAVPWVVTGLLHVAPELAPGARVALWISTTAFSLSIFLAVFDAVPIALERYDLVAIRLTVITSATAVALVVYALLAANLTGLMLINLASTLAGLVAFYVVAHRLLPDIAFVPGLDRQALRRLSNFSAFKFAGSVSGTLFFRFDQFAISSILGVTALAFYAVPSYALLRLLGLVGNLVGPIYPRVSGLGNDAAARRTLYVRAMRMIAVISIPTAAILFILADKTLRYWIGGSAGQDVSLGGTGVMKWLVLGFLIQAMAAVPVIFCEASKRPEVNNSVAVAAGIIHVPLLLFLVPRFGLSGGGMALFLSGMLQTVPFILYASHRVVGVGWTALVGSISRPALAGLVPAGIALAERPYIHNRITLTVGLVLPMLAYSAAALFVRAVTIDEVRNLRSAIARLPATGAEPPGLIAAELREPEST